MNNFQVSSGALFTPDNWDKLADALAFFASSFSPPLSLEYRVKLPAGQQPFVVLKPDRSHFTAQEHDALNWFFQGVISQITQPAPDSAFVQEVTKLIPKLRATLTDATTCFESFLKCRNPVTNLQGIAKVREHLERPDEFATASALLTELALVYPPALLGTFWCKMATASSMLAAIIAHGCLAQVDITL